MNLVQFLNLASGTAANGANAGKSQISLIVMMVLLFGVMYFVMIRPQKKKQKEEQQMRDSIEVGDEITTIGGIVGVGYAKYNLGLVDRTEPGFEALFAYLPNWKTTTLTRLWKGLYILLGTILLVIPGLIMGYTYAMTDYILAEHPDMAPGEVMKGSKAMMEGNRWRLFCLQFSFIGWMLLSSLTFGLGNLALRPYQEAAYAAFYREVSLG